MSFVFGKRSEDNLHGVNPTLVAIARRALQLSPVDFSITEGLRSVERQKELVASGKSQTMASRHIDGCAVDIFPVGSTWQIAEFIPVLKAFKKAGDELGISLRFGVNWKNDPTLPIETKFVDAPHVELPR